MYLIKTGLLLFIITFFTIQAQTAVQNTINGGIAFATGQGADEMRPGIALGLESVSEISNYISLGGHIDYEWLTVDVPDDYVREGVHLWDVSFVPKFYIPFSETTNMSFELDPGFCLSLGYIRSDDYYHYEVQPHFSLVSGINLNVEKFVFGFKYKQIFLENDVSHLVCFCVGYVWDMVSF